MKTTTTTTTTKTATAINVTVDRSLAFIMNGKSYDMLPVNLISLEAQETLIYRAYTFKLQIIEKAINALNEKIKKYTEQLCSEGITDEQADSLNAYIMSARLKLEDKEQEEADYKKLQSGVKSHYNNLTLNERRVVDMVAHRYTKTFQNVDFGVSNDYLKVVLHNINQLRFAPKLVETEKGDLRSNLTTEYKNCFKRVRDDLEYILSQFKTEDSKDFKLYSFHANVAWTETLIQILNVDTVEEFDDGAYMGDKIKPIKMSELKTKLGILINAKLLGQKPEEMIKNVKYQPTNK